MVINKSKLAKKNEAGIGLHIIMIVFSLFCILPLLLIIGISFTGEAEVFESGYKFIPKVFSTEAYDYVFKTPITIIRSYGVTIGVTLVGTLLSLLFTAMLGYVLSRKDFSLSRPLSFLVFFAMLFTGGIVPWYMIITNVLKLKNTYWAMILPYVTIPWFVMLMKGFFVSVPREIIESAKIDGCSEVQAFFRIIVPISTPALTTVGLFIALNYWNDYKLAMYFINDSRMYPLQYMLQQIMANLNFMKSSLAASVGVTLNVEIPSESVRMAMCILAAGPMLVVFPFFQKYFVKGITVGSIKG